MVTLFSKKISVSYYRQKFDNKSLESKQVVVQSRKYRISISEVIRIERVVNDIFDMFFFQTFFRMFIAEGVLLERGNEYTLELEIRLKPLYELLYFIIFLCMSLSIVFVFYIDLQAGLIFLLIGILLLLIQYLVNQYSLNVFSSVLEEDINHFNW